MTAWARRARSMPMCSRRRVPTTAGSSYRGQQAAGCSGAEVLWMAPRRAGMGTASTRQRDATVRETAATALSTARMSSPAHLSLHAIGQQCHAAMGSASSARRRTCRTASTRRRRSTALPASACGARRPGRARSATCRSRPRPRLHPCARLQRRRRGPLFPTARPALRLPVVPHLLL